MSTTRVLETLNTCAEYYEKKTSGDITQLDVCVVMPIYQPTPLGAKELAKYYNKKYDINIQIADHTLIVEQGDFLMPRFAQLRKYMGAQVLKENNPLGILLMHGQQHAVPVLFSCENNTNYMIIFDSTSGCRKKGYYSIATMFSEFNVLLNNGTRQQDDGPCVADGISILKDALRLVRLGTYLANNKGIPVVQDVITSNDRPLFFSVSKPPKNFYLFRMPEELLKTAQINKFVEDAKPNYQKIITKKNQTLEEKRKADRVTVIDGSNQKYFLDNNGYLYEKSRRYARFLDVYKRQSPCFS